MNYSDIESKRFGLRVVRGTRDKIAPLTLLDELDAERADVGMLRVPVTEQHTIHTLDALGIPCICADTLVYFKCNLATCVPQPLRNQNLEYALCDESHHDELDALVDKCFKDYTNHYYSNPVLDKSDILSGYKEWARMFALGNGPTQKCWIVKRGEKILGFATCSFEESRCEGVLYGVAPEASGIGLYSDLIRFTQAHFKSLGFRSMSVSSQIQNYTVQKVWALEGFRLSGALVTIHLNAFFGGDSRTFEFSTVPGEPLNEQIIGKIMAVLQSQHPEARVAGMNYRQVRELQSGVRYSLRVFTPNKSVVQDSAICAVQVRDETSGEIRALAYCNLITRNTVSSQ